MLGLIFLLKNAGNNHNTQTTHTTHTTHHRHHTQYTSQQQTPHTHFLNINMFGRSMFCVSAVVKGASPAFSSSRAGAARFVSTVIIDNADILVVSKPVGPFAMVSS